MVIGSFIVAAAVAFCGWNLDEPRCSDERVLPAALTVEHQSTFGRLARSIRLGAQYSQEGVTDTWAVVDPSRGGDCEDRLLWAAQEIRRLHPELANSYRFVALHAFWDRAGTRRVRRTHLVMVIEGEAGRVVLDTYYREPRAWSDYEGRLAFSPVSGLASGWAPYT
jgi:predicted transglutaminase-like cysteine proteinase